MDLQWDLPKVLHRTMFLQPLGCHQRNYSYSLSQGDLENGQKHSSDTTTNHLIPAPKYTSKEPYLFVLAQSFTGQLLDQGIYSSADLHSQCRSAGEWTTSNEYKQDNLTNINTKICNFAPLPRSFTYLFGTIDYIESGADNHGVQIIKFHLVRLVQDFTHSLII